jgi:3'(2'), 5'-bisphosphate nucleotidase
LQLLKEVVAIAKKAGDAIMDIYNSDDLGVTLKTDNSPLTKADQAANKVIIEGLSLVSNFPILSEESKLVDYAERSKWQTFWLVDPLDGTKEFIKHNGEFTVNIALIRNGVPILGVVYAPAIERLYFAAEGQGAYVQNGDASPISIKAADYHEQRLIVVASRSHAGSDLQSFLDQLSDHDVISMGSSLKICLVAEGRAHLYPRLGPTMEWDTAAAHAIVILAGGKLTDLAGMSLRYNKEELLNPYFVVAGNPQYPWLSCLA